MTKTWAFELPVRRSLGWLTTWGVFVGLVLGFATDAIITAAGA